MRENGTPGDYEEAMMVPLFKKKETGAILRTIGP